MRNPCTLLVLISLLPSLAHAACDREQAGEFANSELSLSLNSACQTYLRPVSEKFQPLSPFLPDQKKADLRLREGNKIFAAIKVDQIEGSKVAAELEGWVNGLIAQGKLASVSEPVKLFEINQEKLCANSVNEMFAKILSDAKTEEARTGIAKSMQTELGRCLRKNYGYANFASREVLLGSATISRLGERVSHFALLHELCHIQNPGIQGQSFEEVYCDAVAFQWERALLSEAELAALKVDFAGQIKPENPYEELLSLRSQLPVCCE